MEESTLTLGATMPRKVPPASAFGERLAELRAERGITQGQLAEALKVSTDELLGVKPLRGARAAEDPEVRRLWKKFQQVLALPQKDRRAVIRLVNSLVTVKAAGRG